MHQQQTAFENTVLSNFFFSHNVFYPIRKWYTQLSIFMTSYLYLLLNWKSLKLAYQVKGEKNNMEKGENFGNRPFLLFSTWLSNLLKQECCQQILLTLSQTNPGFYVSAVQVSLETLWEKEKIACFYPLE